MNIFRMRAPKTAKLTNETYGRWLRAGSPPFDWFMQLGELEQEQLACIGDEYVQDCCVALGYAINDPQAASAGVQSERGEAEGDIVLASKLAENLVRKLTRQSAPKPVTREPRPAPSKATLFGRVADEVAP